jgi:pyrrolysyl-tRNA synthetase-like protein
MLMQGCTAGVGESEGHISEGSDPRDTTEPRAHAAASAPAAGSAPAPASDQAPATDQTAGSVGATVPTRPVGGASPPPKGRSVRRRADPYTVVSKIKLWPSKTGVLHGVRSVRLKGGVIEVHTHCGQSTRIRNSRSGRLARYLRNKRFDTQCPRCRIPAWKMEKFEETSFV